MSKKNSSGKCSTRGPHVLRVICEPEADQHIAELLHRLSVAGHTVGPNGDVSLSLSDLSEFATGWLVDAMEQFIRHQRANGLQTVFYGGGNYSAEQCMTQVMEAMALADWIPQQATVIAGKRLAGQVVDIRLFMTRCATSPDVKSALMDVCRKYKSADYFVHGPRREAMPGA
jgi:hypothetical protein